MKNLNKIPSEIWFRAVFWGTLIAIVNRLMFATLEQTSFTSNDFSFVSLVTGSVPAIFYLTTYLKSPHFKHLKHENRNE